ncbi:MAG: hypothetical protein DYH12_19040, partial [Sorangiineae bacterium PRO1]|nr:hypothetical protein [Sorangiineae bacterium PRO1]
MVSFSRITALGLTALALGAACQVVLGIEDKQLDPNLGTGGTSSGGRAGSDAGGGGPKGSDPV